MPEIQQNSSKVSLLLDIDGNLIGHPSQVLVIIWPTAAAMGEVAPMATMAGDGEGGDLCSFLGVHNENQ